jgi:hypothetical protein
MKISDLFVKYYLQMGYQKIKSGLRLIWVLVFMQNV